MRVFILVVTLVGLAVPSSAAPADARLRALYDSEWAWRVATYADDENNTRPVPDHLPKVDPATQFERLRYWRGVMTKLNAIPAGLLSLKEQVNAQVFRFQIANLIADQEFRTYEMPANSDSSFWSDFNDRARRPFRTLADYRAWISQMRDIPRYFREEIDEMRAGEARGFTPPRVTLEGRDGTIASVANGKPEDTPFYQPFKDMPRAVVPPAEQARLRAEALKTIRTVVQPAYRDLLKYWRGEYVPHARTTLAAQALPNGKAFYRQQIIEYATLDKSPDEIHRIGLAEVASLRAQMTAVMRSIGFKGDLPAFLKYLRTDKKFYAASPQDLLNRAAWIAKEFDGKAALYFGLLPRARFGIVPVPPDQAPFYTSGRGGPGVYYLNTYDLPHRPLYNLTALTLHESAPGHAFQMPLALEDKSLPAFRRNTYISAYGEGWALYCEWLGQEMGMYHTAYDRFGMLGYQIWRAARLVVDTGIHSKGWTRAQALQYLHDNTALPDHEIETEVDRYITWPGQALSYYLGELAIRQARAKAEKTLGAKFNIRAFHDAVLQTGSVPLPLLAQHIDRFIADEGRGPYPDLE
jgi:uncharacterized protein (DUF885 family)